ncbi:unnamed protein product, partial [Adineta steineri]
MLKNTNVYILLIILCRIIVIKTLAVSYNQPKFSPTSTWSSDGIIFANESIVGKEPYSIFINSENIIYVADNEKNRIHIWMNNSIYPTRTIHGDFSYPVSMFVTINHDIYIDNSFSNGKVDKWISETETWVTVMHVKEQCYGLFVDINNTLYCSLIHDHIVVKRWLDDDDINTLTTVVGGTGQFGSSSNRLNTPHGIFVDTNFDLYVADAGNDRIQLFPLGELNGKTVAGDGSTDITFTLKYPTGIILDSDKYLFIVDSNHRRIIGSDMNGFRCLVGCSDSSDSTFTQLKDPFALSFDIVGNIFVTYPFNNTIQKFILLTNSKNFTNVTNSSIKWNAPIDTINNYQKYLVKNDLSLANHHYCNCSANWFGSRCQYSHYYPSKNFELNKIIDEQLRAKSPLTKEYTITDDILMLTCYEGLQCHSAICLDWREICNGILNCENGEDEPDECLLLETNECEDNEYRCRYGVCIPRTFLRDFSYDCMDLSDEIPNHIWLQDGSSCYRSSKIECDFHLCKINEYSCGDGQCLLFQNFPRLCLMYEDCQTQCNNDRDLFFRRKLFHFGFSIGINNSNNISFECQFLMLCISGELNIKLLGYDYTKCLCTHRNQNEKQCLKYFRDYCPTLFVGQTFINILYPFGKLIYNNTPNSSIAWYKPTYFCHKSNRCPALSSISFPLFNNLSCLDLHKFPSWIEEPSKVLIRFSACGITYNPILITDRRLFYCTNSMKFISKHKFLDNSPDCVDGEDETFKFNTTRLGVANANITDRFKCLHSNRSVPRWLLDHAHCPFDVDMLLYNDMCIAASDIGCQYLRGLNSSPLLIPYKDNCESDYILSTPDDRIGCEEWPKYRSCDGYWDLKNGDDELNCSNTITSYITRTISKCHENEHYCIHQNGTMGCISKKYAGDYIDHCLGGTDEKQTTCFYTDA